MIKIFIDDLYWNGRLLIFTWHFKEEFEVLGKNLEFALLILEEGEHELISKNQQKYNVYYWFKKQRYCMSYVVEETKLVLIHIKPKKK